MDKFLEKWPHAGNKHISDFLERLIAKRSASGVYIFSGTEGLGKLTTALFFSKILLCSPKRLQREDIPCGKCQSCRFFSSYGSRADLREKAHIDFTLIERIGEKKSISIEQARELIQRLSRGPFSHNYSIAVIKDAQCLTQEAANSLLKTLEEPAANTVVILTTSNPELLPPTILSRSMILRFSDVPRSQIYDHLVKAHKAGRSEAKVLANFALGRPALAVKLFEQKEFFAQQLDMARAFFICLAEDVNARFDALERILGKRTGRELAVFAGQMIDVWESLARDLLLYKNSNTDLIRYLPLEKQIASAADRFGSDAVQRLFCALRDSKNYLSANVPPKTVMDGIVLSW